MLEASNLTLTDTLVSHCFTNYECAHDKLVATQIKFGRSFEEVEHIELPTKFVLLLENVIS